MQIGCEEFRTNYQILKHQGTRKNLTQSSLIFKERGGRVDRKENSV